MPPPPSRTPASPGAPPFRSRWGPAHGRESLSPDAPALLEALAVGGRGGAGPGAVDEGDDSWRVRGEGLRGASWERGGGAPGGRTGGARRGCRVRLPGGLPRDARPQGHGSGDTSRTAAGADAAGCQGPVSAQAASLPQWGLLDSAIAGSGGMRGTPWPAVQGHVLPAVHPTWTSPHFQPCGSALMRASQPGGSTSK